MQMGKGVVQGVRRPGKSLRVANLSEVLKDCCCRRVQSWKRLQHLDVVEGLSQGVHAKVFEKKTQEGKTFNFVEG